jgi:hypothetical protein
VRNGLAAAAAVGGVLTVAVPSIAVNPSATGDAVVRPAGALPAGDVRMIASIVPVTAADELDLPKADVSVLVKAAGLADAARAIEERRAAAECDVDLDDLGRVKPWVRDAAGFLSCLYDEPDLFGVAQRSRDSDHPHGLAVDLMVRGERGDRIAACALANQEELGVDYVIWEQRVNYGDGWERMSDRGGDTENHFDHVHVSFERSAPRAVPLAERCK